MDSMRRRIVTTSTRLQSCLHKADTRKTELKTRTEMLQGYQDKLNALQAWLMEAEDVVADSRDRKEAISHHEVNITTTTGWRSGNDIPHGAEDPGFKPVKSGTVSSTARLLCVIFS